MHPSRVMSTLNPFSLGCFPDEARREGATIRADFLFMGAGIVALAVGTRLLVWLVHGE